MADGERGSSSQQRLTVKSLGITLTALLLSIGVTVAFGIKDDWWVRILAGAGTTIVLAVLIRVGSGERGVLTRAGDWITQSKEES